MKRFNAFCVPWNQDFCAGVSESCDLAKNDAGIKEGHIAGKDKDNVGGCMFHGRMDATEGSAIAVLIFGYLHPGKFLFD